MSQIPTGLLTRAQIIDHALRRCGNTKASVRTDAITAFNQILFDLYTQYEWPFMVASDSTISITTSQFTLPIDFLVSQDDHAPVLTSINETPQRIALPEVDRATFDLYNPTATGTPTLWHADRANGLGLVWPQANAVCGATLRYRRLPDPTTSDDDIPEF